MIQGAYLHTADDTKEILELASGLVIEEIMND